jgi:hypothetical protein
VRVAGVEEDEGVEDQAEGANLDLHAVLAALVELPGPSVNDISGERVAALLEVAYALICCR